MIQNDLGLCPLLELSRAEFWIQTASGTTALDPVLDSQFVRASTKNIALCAAFVSQDKNRVARGVPLKPFPFRVIKDASIHLFPPLSPRGRAPHPAMIRALRPDNGCLVRRLLIR